MKYYIDRVDELSSNIYNSSNSLFSVHCKSIIQQLSAIVKFFHSQDIGESEVSFDFKKGELCLIFGVELNIKTNSKGINDKQWTEITDALQISFISDEESNNSKANLKKILNTKDNKEQKEQKIFSFFETQIKGEEKKKKKEKGSIEIGLWSFSIYLIGKFLYFEIEYFIQVKEIPFYLKKESISDIFKQIFQGNPNLNINDFINISTTKDFNIEKEMSFLLENAPYLNIGTDLRDVFQPIFQSIVLNRNIEFFQCLCNSLISAEYTIIDDFSEKIEKIGENLKLQKHLFISKDESLKFSSLSNQYIESLIDATFKENKDAVPLENIAIELTYMLNDYFSFNRKMESMYDLSPNGSKKLLDGRVSNDFRYINEYVNQIRLLENSSEQVFGIYKMFPHIFKMILEMTKIDHHFVLTNERFKSLLSLDDMLNGTRKTEKKGLIHFLETRYTNKGGNYFSTFPGFPFVNKSLMNDLVKILKLVDLKNRTLIWKAMQSGSEIIKGYEYIGGRQIIRFEQDERKKFVTNLNASDYIESKVSNEVILGYNQYDLRDSSGNFTDYEKKYIEIIQNKTNFEKYTDDCIKLGKILNTSHNTIPTTWKDITTYNRKIVKSIQEHFISYGGFIKKLDLEIKNSENREHLESIKKTLHNCENTKEILSCSFILKHIEWCLNVTKVVIDRGGKPNKEDFSYLNVATMLLTHYRKLLERLNQDNYYCMNFASLFQDCYYSYKNNDGVLELKRVSFEDVKEYFTKEKPKKDLGLVFIASTWTPPIGYETLEGKYTEFQDKKKKLEIELYDKYFSENQKILESVSNAGMEIKETKKEFHLEMNETKRTTVQTLGIFASFLALATVALGAFTNKDTLEGSIYIKIMLSITFCLSIFILLLDFVIGSHQSKSKRSTIKTASILSAIIIISLILILI